MKIDSPFYSTRETNNSKIGFVYLVAEIGKGNDELPMYFEYNKDGYKGTLKRTQGYLTKNTENEKDISKQQFYSAYVGEIFKTN
ncbi:hypothetical protein B4102_2131 [Heyndrickxia sporothermodurans]|uniref:Uncharacterized protein n=2 Tax=Heyndrickxia sporothermodurans TaxID=46224 RepID=A0A150LGA1_9BACI|nr:hypothetical protein B4102_2131 [Heyndrickxia sporothermodurans]